MKPFSFFGLADKLRGRRPNRKSGRRRLPPGQLLLEELENRTLLSVIPAVTAGTPQNLTNPLGTSLPTTAINPQVAMDPSNSQVLVEFDTFGPADLQYVEPTPPTNNDVATSYFEGRYSLNGGTTWLTLQPSGSTLGLEQNLSNPLLFGAQYTTVGTPSVVFDSQHNAYVIFTEYTASDTAGVVLLSKYNFSGSTPTVVFEDHVLYQWAGQDPAYNPVVAIDTNQASFTDPTATQETQTDPLAATITQHGSTVPQAVYVAWNTDETQTTSAAIPPAVSYIQVEGSDDGGQTFSTQEYVASPSEQIGSSDVLQYLSSATITSGVPVGAALGTFYSDPRDAGHDIVTVSGSTITTLLVNAYGQSVESATTSLPSSDVPIEFTVGDFDSHQYTDLALVYFNSTQDEYFLETYIAQGNGMFAPDAASITLLPGTPAFADNGIVTGNFVNGSGLPDVAVGYTGSSGGAVEILLGNGNGTFSVKGSYPTSLTPSLAEPVSLAVGQFNLKNNTYQDLVVANDGTNDIVILTGNGDGSFNAPTAAGTISGLGDPLDIQAGYFNGTYDDVAILTNSTGSDAAGYIGFGAGDGTFVPEPGNSYASFLVTTTARQIAVGDFSGDGEEDVASVDATSENQDVLSVDAGLGNGNFESIYTFPTAVTGPVALATGNLTGSSLTDLVEVNAGTSSNVMVYAGYSIESAAEGSTPEIVFTQGTASGRVPGGELMFVWNGSTFVPVSSVLTQVYDEIDTNISSPDGTNSTNVTPALASDDYVDAAGGQIHDATPGTGDMRNPTVNSFPISVDVSDGQFTTLDDLSVALNLLYPDVGDLLIQLVVPSSVTALTGITTINLVNNNITAIGAVTGDGLPGVANLGLIPESTPSGTIYIPAGDTVYNSISDQTAFDAGGLAFQANATRSITAQTDPGSNYVGIFQPEGEGTLQTLLAAGVPAAALDGTWTLQITSFALVQNPAPPEDLENWSLNLTSGISTKGFGTTRTVATSSVGVIAGLQPANASPLLGALNGLFSLPTGAYSTITTYSGAQGIGPGASVAIDNTLGYYSPYQGRMYIVYTGYDTQTDAPPINVYIMYSDNNGLTWSSPYAFTDDSGASDFSQGDRAKFDPEIAVDPVTGTVVVTYYDGRFDPDNISVVNSIQTSIDGGQSFSPASFVNELNTATDFLTGAEETIEPIPGVASESSVGFGDRPSSLVVYGGEVTVLFTSNLNAGYDRYGPASDYTYTTGAGIFSTTSTFDDGPRVVSGDEGPITEDQTLPISGASYDNTFAADGTRELTGFVITFDRPVLAADVNSSTVTVMYQNPDGGPAVSVAVGTVTALDLGTTAFPGLEPDNPLATTFYIALATPAFAVGAYSYSIGPAIYDDVRSKELGGTTVDGTAMDQTTPGEPGEPQDAFAMPDPVTGVPFTVPYVQGSEPLVIPGPHVIYTYTAGATPPTAAQADPIEDGTIPQTDNVVVDGSVSSLYILFDRNMNPATFDYSGLAGQTDPILSIMGPDGPITGPFTITADPTGTAPGLAARTFLVTFPSQVLSGTYTITFAPTAEDTNGNAVDTNLNAGVYVVEGTDPTSTQTTVSTYTNSAPVTIVPGQTVYSTITIPNSYVITQTSLANISVQLNIVYPNDPDLEVELISPTGVIIPLFTSVGTFGEPPLANFENTIFDDFATTPIQEGSVPFDVGPFDPQQPLSALIGAGTEGTWTLAIEDTNSNPASGTKQLTYWTLNLPHVTPGTGLGEPVADQFTATFRIFTQSPTNATSSNSYTAIGPASENGLLYDPTTGEYDIVSPNAIAGQVNAIAVDPSDPSGNTVYVGGATGGIWKTTDFLTTNPNGPTWVPLADLGPTNSLNVSGLAVFGVNDDPNQSVIYAITGDSSLFSADGYPTDPSDFNNVEGVGLLRSTDGGQTWEVLTGLNNVNSSGDILPIESSSRDNTFLGQVGFQVAVDPTRLPDGQIAVYAAFSNGLYRSVDSGNTWQLVMAGDCTSVTLAPGSVNANGNETILYAGFQSAAGGSGVYMTTSALTTTSLTLMAGDEGVNNRVQNGTTTPDSLDVPIPVENDSNSPNGKSGRVVVVTPDLTGNPLQNTFYQGWVYAAAINSNGTLAGLYMTKDFGNNWTLISLPAYTPTGQALTVPSNNTSLTSYDPTSHATVDRQGAYDISLAIDPTNPNVVYLGGTINSANAYAGGLIRVDTTNLLDAYAEVGYLNSNTTGALQYGSSSLAAAGDAIGSVSVTDPDDAQFPYGLTNASTGQLVSENGSTNFLDLYRNPQDPFVQPSTLQFQNITQFNNQGTGAQWGPFDYFLDGSTNFQTILTETDPLTGEVRVIVGDDDGVFTGVDDGNALNDQDNQAPAEGFTATITGTRNGNLQLAQLSTGAAQPSTLAADITGALYYGADSGGTAGTVKSLTGSKTSFEPTVTGGAAQSVANILTTGDITWSGIPGAVQDIATDATGSGTEYQFDVPEDTSQQYPFLPTDFFLVTPVTAGQPPSQTTSRTTGLLLSGDNPAQDVGEWLLDEGFNFVVNPVDPSAILVSSNTGNLFITDGPSTGYGVEWFEIAKGSQLDGSNADALAFGAPQSQNNLDNFIYAGTEDGHIYVSTNGGGSWTNISAGLDGTAVQQIVTDPRRGSTDAYAVTLDGVYYMANATATNATWVKLDDTTGQGDLFSLTRGNFDNPSDPMPTLQYLSSIAVDWRYAIPDNPSDPTGPTHPVLYVAGNGGVFRSLDQGQTWTYYPDVSLDDAVTEGGNLPNAEVTGLTLDLGDINPATGFPNTSSGLNQLIVTTFGSGEYAIRLDSTVMVDGKPLSDYLDSPNGGPSVSSVTEVVPIPGTALVGLDVTFSGAIDPTTFTKQEVDELLAPNGQPIAIASIQNITPTPPPGQGSLNNEYEIVFATPQTASGNYQLVIGPGITDDSGNPLASVFSDTLFFTPDSPPTITPSSFAQLVIAPGASQSVVFTIGSSHYNASQLTVTAMSSNTSLVPNSDLVLTNTGANYTLQINAPAGTNTGTTTITITVTDPQTLDSTAPINVIVDQAPVLPVIGDNDTITQPYYDFPYSGALGATSPDGNTLSYSATAYGDSMLYDLQSQYQFTGVGYYSVGAAAYVLHSNQPGPGVGGYYLLRPSDGAIFPYDSTGNYAHAYANGTAIATVGANVYTDPTLLLNAQPPAEYTTLQSLEAQYQFTGVGYFYAGTAAYVLSSPTLNSFHNQYYLIRPSDGAIFAYDGSGSYVHSFASSSPIATLGPSLYTYPDELTDSQASPTLYAQLYQVNSQLDLHELGGTYDTNFFGNQAEWLYSPILNQYGEHYYTLILSGGNSVLHAWEGYDDSSVGAVVATFNTAAVYDNPALLTDATYLPDPAVTASVSNTGTLTIGLPSSSYIGTFKVVVSVTDGLLSTSQTVTVNSTDTAPTLSVTQNSATVTAGSTLSVPHASFPLSDTTTASAAGDQDVTTSATVSSYSQLFSLEQQYRLQGVGYINAGGLAYVFTGAGENAFGNPYYLLSTSGVLYAYDGSGNYATSFARTPIATLSAEVYSDPTLLTNAQPPINYSQYYSLQQQYQFQGLGYFTVGATAYVFQSSQPGPGVGGYYLLTANGNLYAYDGSGNYAHAIANSADLVATLDPGVFVNPSLLLDAEAAPGLYPQLQQDEQQFDLQELPGGFYTGLMGNAAKWLYSPVANSYGQHYYTLVLSANGTQALMYAWDGGNNSIPSGAQPVAVLDPSVYFDPALLLDAKAPEAATGVTVGVTPTGAAASPSTGTLTINSPDSFVGTFQVTVTATDGALTTTETFQIASTDTAPVPNTIPNQTASKSGSPLQVTLSSTDAQNDQVSYTAAVAGYSAAYDLEQIYGFTGVGYFTTTVNDVATTAYVLHSNVLGGVNGYYLVSSTGGIYAYNGTDFASSFSGPNLLGNLEPSIYTTPTLLTNAAAPAAPSATLGVSGNTLTVNVSSVTPGTVFQVIVTASDGAETTRTSFLVTVTA